MSQFSNAFVRQLGRECAHSVYKEATSYSSETTINSDSEFNVFCSKCCGNWIAWSVLSFILPYLMIIPFIGGIKRLFNVYGYVKVKEHTFKYDGRCRGGKRYCCSENTWVEVKKSKDDCTEEEIRTSRIVGLVQIAISVIMFFVSHSMWVYLFTFAGV